MTTQEYITINAPIFAAQRGGYTSQELCEKIQQIQQQCDCTPQKAVKTVIATFDEALKIRETNQL